MSYKATKELRQTRTDGVSTSSPIKTK